jgi:hypothetical protein
VDRPGTADGDVVPDAVADVDGAEEAGSPLSFPFEDLYQALQVSAQGFPCDHGHWAQDFGDAAFWGPAFFIRAGLPDQRQDYLDRAAAGLAHDLEIIDEANSDGGYFLQNLEEVVMAAFGAIEYLAATGERDDLPLVDALVDRVNVLVESLKLYVNIDMQSYALSTYGPTSITALLALLNLRYAELLDTPRSQDRIDFGLKVLDAVEQAAWNGSFYVFDPDRTDLVLELYPNVSMMLGHATAWKLTAQDHHRDRARTVFQGIQPLKDPVKLCYHSPYSAEYMGAQTDDYTTLSSQNYAILAFALTWEITGDEEFRQQILNLMTFIRDYLWVDGRLLHHWMDGHVAVPTDPEYFCTGCNLQFLYVAWHVKEHLYDTQ